MIIVENAANEKAKFRKIFKDFSSLFVCITPKGDKATIKFSGETLRGQRAEMTVIASNTSNLRYNIYLPFVVYTDCVFDLIFDKDGFFIEAYRDCFKDIRVTTKEGTPGYISQVVFKTRRKTTHFTVPCTSCTDIIQ